jgi:hypothetical protein
MSARVKVGLVPRRSRRVGYEAGGIIRDNALSLNTQPIPSRPWRPLLRAWRRGMDLMVTWIPRNRPYRDTSVRANGISPPLMY